MSWRGLHVSRPAPGAWATILSRASQRALGVFWGLLTSHQALWALVFLLTGTRYSTAAENKPRSRWVHREGRGFAALSGCAAVRESRCFLLFPVPVSQRLVLHPDPLPAGRHRTGRRVLLRPRPCHLTRAAFSRAWPRRSFGKSWLIWARQIHALLLAEPAVPGRKGPCQPRSGAHTRWGAEVSLNLGESVHEEHRDWFWEETGFDQFLGKILLR